MRHAPVLVSLALLLAGPPALAAVRRVPQDFPTIQAAVAAASNGDTVLVAPGTYAESIDFLGKGIVVKSVEGPETTVIDAGGGGSVVTFANLEPPAATLEGFTLTGGTGTIVGLSTYGGGVFCSFASPTIRGNVITANTAHFGGGIACFPRGNATIEDNVIRENVASEGEIGPFGSGGGVYSAEESYPTLSRNLVTMNAADYRGGGIAATGDSDPLLEANLVVGNASEIEGGGLACWNTAGPVLVDTVFEENGTAVRGGGVFANGSAPLVLRCTFRANFCEMNGGGMTCQSGADAWIERCRFEANVSGLGGAALHVDLALPTVTSSLFVGNAALCGGEACGGGGILLTTEADATLTGNTFFGNTSTKGGGAIHVLVYSKPLIANSILWGNPGEGGAEMAAVLATPTVVHSIVKGGWPGTAVLDADPRFARPSEGDFHLRFGSPAVDFGWNEAPGLVESDLEGDPRIVDGGGGASIVDLGADELLPEVAARFGTVNAAGEDLADVLRVNGSAGDARRVVQVPVLAAVTVEMAAPPAGPAIAPFALFLWIGEPDPFTITWQPYGLGITGFATPLQPDQPQPREIWNNLGRPAKLGFPTRPSSAAPSTVIERIAGYPIAVTLQGFVLDDGSAASVPASVTNAVVLRIGD